MADSTISPNLEDLINKCFLKFKSQQYKYQVYRDFYENNTDSIMSDYSMRDAQSNRKISVNFAKKFVQMEVGYSLGNPVTYISKSNNKKLIDTIDYNIGSWSKSQDQRLRKESEIYGVSYELDYINSDGEFTATTLTPQNCYVLTDGTAEDNVVMAMHYFIKDFDINNVNLEDVTIKKEYLDVYLSSRIIHYDVTGGTLIYINDETNIFPKVPIIVCPANDEMQSGFHDILGLMSGYNDMLSDEINLINDYRNAYLVIKGAEIDTDNLSKMKSSGIIDIPQGADASWLIKNIQDGFIKNALDNIENKVYDVMNETNLNKDFTSNTSSLVIKTKLTNLENKLAGIEALFQIVLRKRLKNLSDYLQIKTGQGFDIRDIKIQFTRNLSSDLNSLAQVCTQLSPIVPQKTLLSLLPFVNNVDAEMAQFKKEKQENGINLDNIPDNPDNTGGAAVNE